jgi:trigger factor
MKIDLKKLEDSTVEVSFQASAQELEEYIKKSNTLAEASELLIKESWQRAVQEKKLEPIGPAQTSMGKVVPGQPLEFKIVAPVLPEVKLPDYKPLIADIKKEKPPVGDKEIDEALKSWQLSQARYKTLERAAEKGDFVHIEFSSSLFPGDHPQQDRFVLGEGHLIPGFEDNLVGLSANQEKEFTLTYPDPYFAPHLAGQQGKFKVKMLKVEEVDLVGLEELLETTKVADSLESLRQQVKDDLEKQAEQMAEQQWRRSLMNVISEKTEVAVPDILINYEQLRLMESLKRQVSEQLEISFEEYLKRLNQKEEELKKTYRLEAEKNVKEFLILGALQKSEKVEVTDQEIFQETEKVKSTLSEEQKKEVDQAQLRAYTKDALKRDKLFQKLSLTK